MLDEDDSMAANPEPVRRSKRDADGQWIPVFRDTPKTAPVVTASAKVCRDCRATVAILHSIAPGIVREFCGECQGRANRRL
jgi:hypothetical protein